MIENSSLKIFQSDLHYIPLMNNFSVRAAIILLRADLIRIWISSQCSFPLVFTFCTNTVPLINKLTNVLGMMKNSQYAAHPSPSYSTCDCQDFQACRYWSAVQPVEAGRRGCPDLMDYCMRPRGTGTSVLTWLFNPRVGRDLAVSRPPSLTCSRSPNTLPNM